MIGRCEDKNHAKYQDYGARGIRVCERWHDFNNFLADMGPRPKGTTLDRIKGERDYEPDNCRWTDAKTQRHNRCR
jgi:hypothetical protein